VSNRQRRTPTSGEAPTTAAKGGARDRLRDASSKELVQLARKVGNDQVQALLGQASGKRDALLAFVERRLAQVQIVQRAEQEEMTRSRQWFHRVGRREPGFTLPDPTRWRRTALLYKRAGEALCAGDLGRGAHLLDQAVAAERAAFETIPAQVEVPVEVVAPDTGAEERPFVTDGESAPATQAPGLFQKADAIVRITDHSEELPVPETRRTHRWWEAPEADEEAKQAAAKKAGEKKASEAAQESGERPAVRTAVARDGADRARDEEQGETRRREQGVDGARATAPAVAAPGPEAALAPPRRSKGRKPDGS
jgi:hypothetical protein